MGLQFRTYGVVRIWTTVSHGSGGQRVGLGVDRPIDWLVLHFPLPGPQCPLRRDQDPFACQPVVPDVRFSRVCLQNIRHVRAVGGRRADDDWIDAITVRALFSKRVVPFVWLCTNNEGGSGSMQSQEHFARFESAIAERCYCRQYSRFAV